jgi:hypothetical protein
MNDIKHKRGIDKMIGNEKNMIEFRDYKNFNDIYNLYLKIPFFFNKNYGLSLPFIALYNSNIKLIIKFKDFDKLYFINSTEDVIINNNTFKCDVLIDYILLEDKEKKLFANKRHQYLIE